MWLHVHVVHVDAQIRKISRYSSIQMVCMQRTAYGAILRLIELHPDFRPLSHCITLRVGPLRYACVVSALRVTKLKVIYLAHKNQRILLLPTPSHCVTIPV